MSTEVEAFVQHWFHLLDVHGPFEEGRACVDPEQLRFVFPETTIRDLAGLEEWWTRVCGTFFDEQHTILRIEPVDDAGHYAIDVAWRASTWTPPEARSTLIHMLAKQTWEIVQAADGSLRIRDYVVHSLAPYDDNQG